MVVTEIHEPGVVGLFARPDGNGPWPAVVALPGSSGGFGPTVGWAPALASAGIAVLAVAYFAAPGLPSDLVDIDVEVVERAAAWLLEEGHAAGGTVGVIGISRGSELALLASVLVDAVGPAVALAPSGVMWSGIGSAGPLGAPAWRFRGEALPFADAPDTPPSIAPSGAVALRPIFEATLADPSHWAHAEIAVERAKGPILLVSGEDDAMWPSTPMAEMIERRATARGLPHRVTHLRYPRAGHTSAGVPDFAAEMEIRHPLTGATYALGGTTEGNAAARADSWPRIVEFITRTLTNDGAASRRLTAGS